jgi:hypothetical protein
MKKLWQLLKIVGSWHQRFKSLILDTQETESEQLKLKAILQQIVWVTLAEKNPSKKKKKKGWQSGSSGRSQA